MICRLQSASKPESWCLLVPICSEMIALPLRNCSLVHSRLRGVDSLGPRTGPRKLLAWHFLPEKYQKIKE